MVRCDAVSRCLRCILRCLLLTLCWQALAACAPAPLAADPALWEVTAAGGARGYLFGTVHALKQPVAWRTPPVGAALDASDRIVVEVADVARPQAIAAAFATLAHTPGQPPLSARVPPRLRKRLGAALTHAGLADTGFAATETWAAALILARALSSDQLSENGIDRAVIAAAGPRPVVELEGASGQLAIFDRLAEADQRALLAAVVTDADALDGDAALTDAWRRGDMAPIVRETRRGILADPELRTALLTARNRAWTARIAAMLARGERPFVAVGAAHMAGPDGLPAMLAATGLRVRRIT